jgi:hypothetical protein
LNEANPLLTDCINGGSPMKCVGDLDSIEQMAAAARNQAVICGWAADAWMPRISAMKRRAAAAKLVFGSPMDIKNDLAAQRPDGSVKPGDTQVHLFQLHFGASPGC